MLNKSDKIILKEMRFFAKHGVGVDEKISGQEFSINLEIECILDKVFKSDLIDDTVDYGEIYNIVKDIIMHSSYNLLETIANKIVLELLLISKVQSVYIEVNKLNPPIKDINIAYTGVSLYRTKSS